MSADPLFGPKHAAWVAGMRRLADWAEAHPDLPLPQIGTIFTGLDLDFLAWVEVMDEPPRALLPAGNRVTAAGRVCGLPFEVELFRWGVGVRIELADPDDPAQRVGRWVLAEEIRAVLSDDSVLLAPRGTKVSDGLPESAS